jgi:hypothetical protein
MKNAADIEPSRETSLLNSNAISGNMADILNQFIPYTILAIIKENEALASELNILLFFLFVLIFDPAPNVWFSILRYITFFQLIMLTHMHES